MYILTIANQARRTCSVSSGRDGVQQHTGEHEAALQHLCKSTFAYILELQLQAIQHAKDVRALKTAPCQLACSIA